MYKEILAFFDILKKPLKRSELDFYSSSQFRGELENVPELLFAGEKYFSLMDQYSARNVLKEYGKFSSRYLSRVLRFRWLFSCMPFIKMVAICNTSAFGNVRKNSDIDLFIITKGNRMFLARSLVTFALHVFAVRRHGNKIAGRFCLSFFVSEEDMDLDKILLKDKLDVYMLFWMRSLKPLVGQDAFVKFLDANSWFKKYYNSIDESSFKYLLKSKLACFKRFFELLLNNRFGDFLESKLATWQLERANAKASNLEDSSGTVISRTMLKFHDSDKRSEIADKWEKLLSS